MEPPKSLVALTTSPPIACDELLYETPRRVSGWEMVTCS
jgi:hypothetical protein